mgnify:CR=1 FL=1
MQEVTQPLITMIIPVYNIENYVSRCVESAINQSYENLEILLIDDGSEDASGEICDQYGEKCSNIRVIHKENGGLSEARNVGIEAAGGEYLVFLDGDDFVTKNYVENLFNAIEQVSCDLAISMFLNVVDDQGIELNTDGVLENLSEECLRSLLYQRGIETSAPGKIYKRELIGELRFPVGRLYEDVMFTVRMIARSSRIAIVDNVDYMYYQRQGSIQYQQFDKRKMDSIHHSLELEQFVERNYPKLIRASHCRRFNAACNIVLQIPSGEYPEEKQYLWTMIKKLRTEVIADPESRAKSKIAALVSFLGYDILRTLYKQTQVRGRNLS